MNARKNNKGRKWNREGWAPMWTDRATRAGSWQPSVQSGAKTLQALPAAESQDPNRLCFLPRTDNMEAHIRGEKHWATAA